MYKLDKGTAMAKYTISSFHYFRFAQHKITMLVYEFIVLDMQIGSTKINTIYKQTSMEQ